MNEFEGLCKLASQENWCWKLFCTTCGHMHFRYAFAELASGKSPNDPAWLIHNTNTQHLNSLGPLPRVYTMEQKENVVNTCRKANLSLIAKTCKFPDWLGYLGLVLEHMNSGAESFEKLSRGWALQFLGLVSEGSRISIRLLEISKGNGLLNIQDLEECESDLMLKNENHEILALSRLRP